MQNIEILIPIVALAFWTFIILNVLGMSRIRAGAKGQIKPGDFRSGESSSVPDFVRLTNRNYMNLLELPVLFYIGCILVFIAGIHSPTLVTLAWLFVALRVVHSCIHLTYNNVMHRLFAFVASNTILLVMWVLLAVGLAK